MKKEILEVDAGTGEVTLRSRTPRTVAFFERRGVTAEMERLATGLLDAAVACMEALASHDDKGGGALQAKLDAMESRLVASIAESAERAGGRVASIESGVQAHMMRLVQSVESVVSATVERIDVDAMSTKVAEAVRAFLSGDLEGGRLSLRDEVVGLVRGPMRRQEEQLEDLKARCAQLPDLVGSRAGAELGAAALEIRRKLEDGAGDTREALRECLRRASATAEEVAKIWEDARDRSAEQRAQAAVVASTVRAAVSDAIREVEMRQAQACAVLDAAVRHLESIDERTGAIGGLQGQLDAIARQATVVETKRAFHHATKGHEGESRLFDLLVDRLPSREHYEVERCSGVAQQCDIRIRRLDHPDVRVESKAIGKGTGEKCRQRDVEKFQRDLLNLNAHGIFVSLHSGICGKSDGVEVERLANNRLAVYLSHNEYNVDLIYDMLQLVYLWDRCCVGGDGDPRGGDPSSVRVTPEAMKRVSQYCKDLSRKVSAAKGHLKETLAILSELTLDTIEQLLVSPSPSSPSSSPSPSRSSGDPSGASNEASDASEASEASLASNQASEASQASQALCTTCGRAFATARGLAAHLRTCKRA